MAVITPPFDVRQLVGLRHILKNGALFEKQHFRED